MATDNFDLQGWMRENKQGPFAGLNQETFKSSKPKSKTGLNEGLMGMIDLQPVGSLSEDIEEEMMDDEDAPEIEDTFNAPSEFDMEDDDSMMGGTDTSFDKIQAALVKVQDSMGKLLAGFKSGTISKDDYVAKRKTLQSMRDRLEAQLDGSDDDAFEL